MKKLIQLILLIISIILLAKTTSYFTGNNNDVYRETNGGVCLMGGATEDDNAMIWFLERSNGGDILVLRTSGSDGYNNYLFGELGVNVNSVETIVLNNSSAADESYIHNKVLNAEAIWLQVEINGIILIILRLSTQYIN